ncbi:hypothetical protein [Piscirickettsia salmonis]|nr:hypothetical protein [Piscirickettsia salmonis]
MAIIMRISRDTHYHYIAQKGKLMFCDLATTKLFESLNIQIEIGKPISLLDFFKYPLGSNYLLKDILNLKSTKTASISRHAIAISHKLFFFSTITREPLFSEGKVVGIINKGDLSLTQTANNPCFKNVVPLTYNSEKFSKADLQILLLLAQFNDIKAKEISTTLEIQMRTAYMYKYELLNKLRDTFGFDDGDDIDYNHCLAKIFHLSENPDNHLLLLPDDKLQEHFTSLNKKRTKKNMLTPINNFDIKTSIFLSIRDFFDKARKNKNSA